MTNEQAQSELMQIYMSLSEEKKKALDVAFKAMEQEPCEDANANQHNSNALNDVGQHINALEVDAVSRQAVLASIKNLYPDMPIVDIFGARRKWLEKYATYFECENAIEQLPSVTPQPKTGHWLSGICDNCGYDWGKDAPIASVPNFCPNCGAKMD